MTIFRDDGLELGAITSVVEMPKSKYGAYQGSGHWLATSRGRSKYFVHYDNAVKWLEQRNKNIFPISRLEEFLNR